MEYSFLEGNSGRKDQRGMHGLFSLVLMTKEMPTKEDWHLAVESPSTVTVSSPFGLVVGGTDQPPQPRHNFILVHGAQVTYEYSWWKESTLLEHTQQDDDNQDCCKKGTSQR
jgi:hypothetical protein